MLARFRIRGFERDTLVGVSTNHRNTFGAGLHIGIAASHDRAARHDLIPPKPDHAEMLELQPGAAPDINRRVQQKRAIRDFGADRLMRLRPSTCSPRNHAFSAAVSSCTPSPHSTRSAVTQFDCSSALAGDNDRRAAASAAAISLTPWDPLD